MSKIAALLLVVLSMVASLEAPQWIKTERDIKIPLALRVVNEGLANDGVNWYFSQQHFLVKTTFDPITTVMSNIKAIPPELRDLGYAHIGDIDSSGSVIYGGIEVKGGSHPGVLAKWRTSDLSLIGYNFTTMDGMPWVAVDAKTRRLYSAVWNDRANLSVFDLDTFAPIGVVTVPAGLPGEIQGGAFWKDELYLSTNGNCSVYRLNLETLDISRVLSDVDDKPWVYEMEGIDFWDKSASGLGIMHIYGNFMGAEKTVHNFNPPAV